MDPEVPQQISVKQRRRTARDPLETLAIRVASKLEEGDFKGAVRLASSEDSVAEPNDRTLQALKEKHPAPHPNYSPPPAPAPTEGQAIQVSPEEVARAIRSFPCGSEGGPDGLRPQHLKDMIGSEEEGGGSQLLRALTSFTNLILEGKASPNACPYFFGASLIALEKKDGGVRPIAVGCTLRRLVAKCAGYSIMQDMAELLRPKQLGFGISRGAEAAVHATRIFLHNLQPQQLILKLDFRNTFNSLHRDKMLTAVRQKVPGLFPLIHSAYSSPSCLFFGESTLQSAEGVQQGDPLGPLQFCLTIHDMLQQVNCEFGVFYLDDGTLGGSLEEVLRDVRMVEQVAGDMGLQMNHSKLEIICVDPTTTQSMLDAFPDFCVVSQDHATLLGSPIGNSVEGINDTISAEISALAVMGVRLRLLHAHDAFCLLKNAFTLPKMLHTL